MKRWFALLICAVLALTGQAMTVARGAPDPVGQMVICTGQGLSIIYVDAEGQPTPAPHYCPDCALASLAGLLPVSARLTFDPGWAIHSNGTAEQGRAPSVPYLVERARGPPMPV